MKKEFRKNSEVFVSQNESCRTIKDFLSNDDGMGVVEVVLIIVVLIGLVLIFKTQINSIIKTLLTNIKNDALAI